MKPLVFAAALFVLQAPTSAAEPAKGVPSEALVDRFIAAIPDREAMTAADGEIDSGELERLTALNPGKEAQLRGILEANVACTDPAIAAGTLRMMRTIARDLGEEKLKKLVGFYEGPDYAAFQALALRMESAAAPSAGDKAAMARFMAAYPLQDFMDGMNRAGQIIAGDKVFVTAAMDCAEKQMAALDAAGLKAN